MATDAIQNCSWDYHWKDYHWILSRLNHVILTYFANFSFSGMLVNGDIVSTCEATSSPSHINATKGSSVWLYWNYTYIGDGRHGTTVHFTSEYENQIIGINSAFKPRFQSLAKRIGQNGALVLESSVPAPFNGRVEVISSNSTLVIYDLQCSDSMYHFTSDVNVYINIGAGHVLHDFRLKPVITLTVSEVHAKIDSNPCRYYVEYNFDNVGAKYCGRQLQVTLENGIGSSPTKHIRVFVLLNLDKPLNLTAKRLHNGSCFEMKWRKIESAACDVQYVVTLKDAHGKDVNKSSGINIKEAHVCNTLQNVDVTEVQLTVKFREMSKTLTAFVAESKYRLHTEACTIPYTTQTSRTTQKSTQQQSIDGVTTLSKEIDNNNPASSLGVTTVIVIITGSLVTSLLVIVLVFLIIRRKRTSDERQREPGTENCARDNYMDLLPRSNAIVQLYTQLENEYEEIGELRI